MYSANVTSSGTGTVGQRLCDCSGLCFLGTPCWGQLGPMRRRHSATGELGQTLSELQNLGSLLDCPSSGQGLPWAGLAPRAVLWSQPRVPLPNSSRWLPSGLHRSPTPHPHPHPAPRSVLLTAAGVVLLPLCLEASHCSGLISKKVRWPLPGVWDPSYSGSPPLRCFERLTWGWAVGYMDLWAVRTLGSGEGGGS